MSNYPRPNRRSHRLHGHDYTQPGSYFVTLCAAYHECLFGDIVEGAMKLNVFGKILHDEWFRTPIIRPEITLDAFVIMPNHIHGIINIHESVGDSADRFLNDVRMHNVCTEPSLASTGLGSGSVGTDGHPSLRRPPRSLGSIIVGFKSITVRRINEIRNSPGQAIWQPNYHDRIIRTQTSLNRIRRYITMNPLNWGLDRENKRRRGIDA